MVDTKCSVSLDELKYDMSQVDALPMSEEDRYKAACEKMIKGDHIEIIIEAVIARPERLAKLLDMTPDEMIQAMNDCADSDFGYIDFDVLMGHFLESSQVAAAVRFLKINRAVSEFMTDDDFVKFSTTRTNEIGEEFFAAITDYLVEQSAKRS